MSLDKEDKKIYKMLKKQLSSIYDIFESETFIASIYLLRYIDSGEIKYYQMYLEKMEKFSFEERKQVLLNVAANLSARKNKKQKEEHNKVKAKDKDG